MYNGGANKLAERFTYHIVNIKQNYQNTTLIVILGFTYHIVNIKLEEMTGKIKQKS